MGLLKSTIFPRTESPRASNSSSSRTTTTGAVIPSGGVPTDLPEQVAVLICAGDILNTSPSEVADIFSHLTGGEADQETIDEWVDQFGRLQKLELLEVKQELEEQRREAVISKDGEFYTLWENPNKPG